MGKPQDRMKTLGRMKSRMDRATADRTERGKQRLGTELVPKEPTSAIGVAFQSPYKHRSYLVLAKSANAHHQWTNNSLRDS